MKKILFFYLTLLGSAYTGSTLLEYNTEINFERSNFIIKDKLISNLPETVWAHRIAAQVLYQLKLEKVKVVFTEQHAGIFYVPLNTISISLSLIRQVTDYELRILISMIALYIIKGYAWDARMLVAAKVFVLTASVTSIAITSCFIENQYWKRYRDYTMVNVWKLFAGISFAVTGLAAWLGIDRLIQPCQDEMIKDLFWSTMGATGASAAQVRAAMYKAYPSHTYYNLLLKGDELWNGVNHSK